MQLLQLLLLSIASHATIAQRLVEAGTLVRNLCQFLFKALSSYQRKMYKHHSLYKYHVPSLFYFGYKQNYFVQWGLLFQLYISRRLLIVLAFKARKGD